MSQSRTIGCLLGLAVGDALGAHFEGQTPDWIKRRFRSVESLLADLPEAPWHYTDDTQMAIGVAEALAKEGAIVEASLCAAFVENFQSSRGYGRGARVILNAMEEGEDYKFWAEQLFPGGSFGNGAAMRVAPVGLLFAGDPERLIDEARLSALPTHVHPLGVEGAQLIALAVAACLTMETFDRDHFFSQLESRAAQPEFRDKLAAARSAQHLDDLRTLGNGIAALDSVATAIGCFALTPDSYERVIGNAILLGGDTDTIAAMAGALAGAAWRCAIPLKFLDALENGRKGRDYIIDLGKALHARKSPPA